MSKADVYGLPDGGWQKERFIARRGIRRSVICRVTMAMSKVALWVKPEQRRIAMSETLVGSQVRELAALAGRRFSKADIPMRCPATG